MSYDSKVYDLVAGFIDDALDEMEDKPNEDKEKELKEKLAQFIQGEIEDWLEFTMPRELKE